MSARNRLLTIAAAGVGWGLFESQWVRLGVREVPIAGLDPALDGLRIGHLSDLHVGAPGLNGRSLASGVDLIRGAEPDLVVITRRSAGPAVAATTALRRSLALLDAPLGAFAILGNHDHADGHDPFADGVALTDLDGTPVRLLQDETASIEARGARIHIGGLAPRTFEADEGERGAALVDKAAGLRLLLCHFPRILDRVQPGEWQLDPQRAPARRPALHPVPGWAVSARAPEPRLPGGRLRAQRDGDARLARARHHLRPAPLRGPARGHPPGAARRVDSAAWTLPSRPARLQCARSSRIP